MSSPPWPIRDHRPQSAFGTSPYVAYLAKEMGAVVVAVVTTPFSFEGSRRLDKAIAGVSRIRPYVDNLIVIHNDRLLEFVDHDAEMLEAFRTADEVVTQGIMSVSELINVPGEINVDFADVRTILSSSPTRTELPDCRLSSENRPIRPRWGCCSGE